MEIENNTTTDQASVNTEAEASASSAPIQNAVHSNIWQRLWQKIRDFFSDSDIKSDAPSEETLISKGSPVSNFVYRYVYKKQCPYCFHYVTGKVYLETPASQRQTIVSRIPFSMPKLNLCVCPTCKEVLPSDFFENESSSIAIVGGQESGKSSFITLLCELLINHRTTLSELGIFGSIINQKGKELFEDNRRILIGRNIALSGTTIVEEPIILRLHSIHHSKVMYITLIDTPGEHFNRIDELTKHHANLRYAQAIVFLMNPIDIRELYRLIQDFNPNLAPLRSNYNTSTSNFDIVENLYELFRRGERVKSNQKINIPTAFCLSRADLLEDIANISLSSDFESDLSDPKDIIDEVQAASEELIDLLEDSDINLVNVMKTRFSNFNIFPVSPLGGQPVESALGQEIHGGVDPKGLLYPIIWILKETNFIK